MGHCLKKRLYNSKTCTKSTKRKLNPNQHSLAKRVVFAKSSQRAHAAEKSCSKSSPEAVTETMVQLADDVGATTTSATETTGASGCASPLALRFIANNKLPYHSWSRATVNDQAYST